MFVPKSDAKVRLFFDICKLLEKIGKDWNKLECNAGFSSHGWDGLDGLQWFVFLYLLLSL